MCSSPEVLTIVLALGAGVAMLLAASSMSAVARRLETAHPAVWETFRKPSYLKYFETPQDGKFEWYILTGKYRLLRDDLVTRAGNKACWFGLLGFVLAVLATLTQTLPSYDSVFACLPHS
jgi:hypothetical protein